MGQTKANLKAEPRHIRIYKKQVDTDAWRALGPSAVKVLVSMLLCDYGINNGGIFFSERRGAKVTGLSRGTVRKAINELIEKGFVYRTKVGSFSQKIRHAAEYGMTWTAGPPGPNRAPTHRYEKWKQAKPRVQFALETGADFDPHMEKAAVNGAITAPPELEKWLISDNREKSESDPLTVSHGGIVSHCARHGSTQSEAAQEIWQAELRSALWFKLKGADPGEQTSLAERAGIPIGTLSKFKHGRPLPLKYRYSLSEALELFRASEPITVSQKAQTLALRKDSGQTQWSFPF
ncbi:hypothetical protein GCM10023115_05750 [Pontixanthobacter gangjinensis]|uniref:Helix-turn-helix domain-containing protein n=1 Tax=Pontixanthobacter gangjinensis TaxID=1028742 RepID=A0A6I4SJN2_9SPHN|nr:helix-turn-helix domain-containing protein [Pontixanthobacter gangjinensis]MXO55824.1 hypothetical protein [Pontixanthobacter gangjinensis]